MTRGKQIIEEAKLCASANTQIIGDWGEHYLGFIHGAKWADQHPHWISVEEEGNPKDTGWYIFTMGKIVDVGYYLGGNEWRGVHPTHWMPLPQAPTVAFFATVKEKGGEE